MSEVRLKYSAEHKTGSCLVLLSQSVTLKILSHHVPTVTPSVVGRWKLRVKFSPSSSGRDKSTNGGHLTAKCTDPHALQPLQVTPCIFLQI